MLEANRLSLDTLVRRIDGTVDADSRVEGKVVIEPGATPSTSTRLWSTPRSLSTVSPSFT